MFSQYQLQYAKKHGIPADTILDDERLEMAAFLENLVRTQTMTVSDARRRFVNEYPEANRLPVPKYVYDKTNNTYWIDSKYADGSVLNLIQPYDDSLW